METHVMRFNADAFLELNCYCQKKAPFVYVRTKPGYL
jgi:hypothetical protein